MTTVSTFHTSNLSDGINIWYREAGSPTKPTFLLLHGFPTSSNMFRQLIPLLAEKYHVIAPDLPGFGFTTYPENYLFNFANLASTIEQFVNKLAISKFFLYVFDYGAPVGFRLALKDPSRVLGLVSQNGNAYKEGLDDRFWSPFQLYWKTTADDTNLVPALEAWLKDPKNVTDQYFTGVRNTDTIDPSSYTLDVALIGRPDQLKVQLALAYDYKTNLELYPEFQKMFRETAFPLLVTWGANDQIFTVAGAEAYKRDSRNVRVKYFETGHFALEDSVEPIASDIIDFFGSKH